MKETRHPGWAWLGVASVLLLGAVAFGARQTADQTHPYALNSSVSIDLTPDWQKTTGGSSPPPAGLGPYAPPFHFSETLMLASDQRNALLELAVSDNPLMGHDSYWLDSQMHSAPGSGMSMTDFLFYLFLPPSRACLDHTLQVHADASRAPQTGDPTDQADLQVFYPCEYSSTTSDLYSSQLSSGMIFQQTNGGPHAFPLVSGFDVASMEQVDVSGLTFFVFEAQSQKGIDADTVNRFNLPKELEGAHADFFWAIGAESPFPFEADENRKDVPLIHLAYAGLAPGPNPNKRPEFMDLLHHIQYHKPADQPPPQSGAQAPATPPGAQPGPPTEQSAPATPSAQPAAPDPTAPPDQSTAPPDQTAPPADQSAPPSDHSAPSPDQTTPPSPESLSPN